MKKQILSLAILLCLVNNKSSAQNSNSTLNYRDTLIIHINQNIKVFFIGNDLEDMVKYKKADSLKALYIADLKKALQNEAFPADSKMVHYFVHPSGKRRLKAENVEFQDSFLDVEKEIQSIKLNLPAYTYVIHDIESAYQLQIYLNDPNSFRELENVSLDGAILSIASDKKRLRKSYSIALQVENEQWLKLPPHLKKPILFETDPTIGLGVLGNQVTPELGAEVSYVITDKYSAQHFKIGISLRNYLLTEYANKEFSNFYLVSSFNLNIKALIPKSNSAHSSWVGFEFGALKAEGGYLNNNYKFGFILGRDSFQVGFDFISPDWSLKSNSDDLIYGFSVRFSL